MKNTQPALPDINTDTKLTFNEFPPVSKSEWESVIKKDLKGSDYKEKLRWETGEGIEALPFYRREDLENISRPLAPLNRQAGWEIRQRITSSDLESANKQALHVLKQGADSVYFDLPPESVQSREDVSTLLADIPKEKTPMHFGRGVSSVKMTEWVEKETQNPNISFAIDPFSRAAATGKLVSRNDLVQVIKPLSPLFKIFAVGADVYGNAGATITQQLALALATGNEWLGLAGKTGIPVQELNRKIHFNFSIGSNYFLETAKFRAFRLMWKQILTEYDKNTAFDSGEYLHAETALWNKAATDAHNNMLRSTTEAMSAIIGGCNAVTVNRYDETFEKESGFSSRVARNIQLILKEEAYFNKVADPAAGSYYVEVLTDKIAEESWRLFRELESRGGLYESLESGQVQKWISNSRQEKAEAFKNNQKTFLGVNKYQPESNDQISGSEFQAFWQFAELPEGLTFEKIESISPLNLEAELTGVAQS